jgi:hypothetical protein
MMLSTWFPGMKLIRLDTDAIQLWVVLWNIWKSQISAGTYPYRRSSAGIFRIHRGHLLLLAAGRRLFGKAGLDISEDNNVIIMDYSIWLTDSNSCQASKTWLSPIIQTPWSLVTQSTTKIMTSKAVSAERLIGKTGLDFSEDINAIITDYSIWLTDSNSCQASKTWLSPMQTPGR